MGDMNSIKTRVSELEVINDLFRGRVQELEMQLDASNKEKEDMGSELKDAKRRIEMLESELNGDGGHRAKRLRVEDFVRDDASGSEN